MNVLVSACLLGVCCRYSAEVKADDRILRLLEQENICLIPVCPEQLGGMETPRLAAERVGDKVINQDGEDVTGEFQRGAEEALRLAKLYHCDKAILKERSPSCGYGSIYDGSFQGNIVQGNGVTAQLLSENGIEIIGENSPLVERLG